MIRPYLYIAAGIALIGAGWWLYNAGRDAERGQDAIDQIEAGEETRKRIEDALEDLPDDDDALLRWLRERGGRF